MFPLVKCCCGVLLPLQVRGGMNVLYGMCALYFNLDAKDAGAASKQPLHALDIN